MCDQVGVMYLGKIVEKANKNSLFNQPKHPYTTALLSSIPYPDPNVKSERIILQGDIPSPVNPPNGCSFHTRCQHVMDICRVTPPAALNFGSDHQVVCHLFNSVDGGRKSEETEADIS